jgi:K+-transporting ATPase ATPase C chain
VAVFPRQANGSLDPRATAASVGSALIGQAFRRDPGYFWGGRRRPHPYNAAASTGSNQGPLAPRAARRRAERAARCAARPAAAGRSRSTS